MRGAIAIGRLQFIAHLALRRQRQAFLGNRRSGDVATQAFQLLAFSVSDNLCIGSIQDVDYFRCAPMSVR